MDFKQVIEKFRNSSFTEKDKGTKFEKLMRTWLRTDSRYNILTDVWLWEDFPSKKDFGGKDTGIDLVAKTEMGDYWAIQCKFYAEDTVIDKPAVDSFLATSSRTFMDTFTLQKKTFSNRLWISTTDKWGANAEESIQNQNPPVSRIGLKDLEISPVDWNKLLEGIEGKQARLEGKKPMAHQLKAISEAYDHYLNHDRGKLIMACGTGKTYTSLKIAEEILNGKGLVLFLVPSISLLGQSLNAWMNDTSKPMKAICICSDGKASRKKTGAEEDDVFSSTVDLALPATTDANSICRQLKQYRDENGMTVVFSTYQSIDAVEDAQKMMLAESGGEYGIFELVICDEAHRTTGVIFNNQNESNFVKVHDNEHIQAKKRLYMTATPRLYGESAKVKASLKNCELCSMDKEETYGKEFYRVNFSYAVSQGLLTDYKVLVLTVNEEDIPASILREVKDENRKELNFDDTSKLIGVINGLSKVIRGDGGKTWEADPRMMKRAVAFCHKIGKPNEPGTSKNVSEMLPSISEKYIESIEDSKQREQVVRIETNHIDGSMNSLQRNRLISWLEKEPEDEKGCKVLTNVRCLSEGVDVPALDAVLFLSARNSQVDVVQSVGRVMRNFRKGEPGEKKYGYIIIPIVVPQGVKPEDALNDNKSFEVVWSILNALRSHDDHFNALVNQMALNKNKDSKVIIGGPGIGTSALDDGLDKADAVAIENQEVAKQLKLRFGEFQQGIYAKLVEKCGDRLYWENWAKEVGLVAQKFIARIKKMVIDEGVHKEVFELFLKELRKNINPSVNEGQVIEMLAQHMITRPVFDALFQDYQFVKNNPVSRSMQRMVGLLEGEGMSKDLEILDKFYDSVRINVGDIDNLAGKQTIIKNLYEKFFKGAFPLTVEQLGIVYTPIECVDFIIHSVEHILNTEFGTSMTNSDVHIQDPFTGTATFVTRLLQSGVIKKEDLERKYLHEIICNEIVLLAYYIADVNIESVFHDLVKRDTYLPYNGICLTDTFYTAEVIHEGNLIDKSFRENAERIRKQRRAPVRVIIGNPPYSVGQKSANDNAQNLKYPVLDSRIANTYASHTNVNNKNSLYDSYIKAFRWASDRICEREEGGIVAFISNGAWINGNAQDGMRKCMENEFTSIYVLNLRGNALGNGEQRRKESGNVFGEGTRTSISITFLVKNPAKFGKAVIYYHDIGDYLNREQKLKMVKDFKHIGSKELEWKVIQPNEKHDWINQRDGVFDTLISINSEKKFDIKSQSYFCVNSRGLETGRDAWVYNYNTEKLDLNINSLFKEYTLNLTCNEDDINRDETQISWTSSLLSRRKRSEDAETSYSKRIALYRPFMKENVYFGNMLIHRKGQFEQFFPTPNHKNLLICVSGVGVTKDFTCVITDIIPDLELIGKSQCFPLYWYEESKNTFSKGGMDNLFAEVQEENKYIRRDGITDWILKEVRNRYGGTKNITKEMIFYYVYGLLHSPDYRERFADDLKKSLPRIPIVEKVEDFMDFYKAGKKLADLHLNYEEVPPYQGVKVICNRDLQGDENCYDYYRVPDKLRFKSKQDKSTISYNGHITIENIPIEVYEYVVNGKSAIEWIVERYCVSQDRNSLIVNDANDWGREHGKPRYILDLLLSVINVSVQTVEIVKNLPKLTF